VAFSQHLADGRIRHIHAVEEDSWMQYTMV
jgi:hypothetical protein